jgi:hypothetical protein
VLCPVFALAMLGLGFASMATTVPGCSIRGISDGVRPQDAGGGAPGGDAGDGGACSADLAQDQANCGRCGRACSGPCNDGTCDVTTIAEGQLGVAALATNGTVVAWVANGRNLRFSPVDGKAAPTQLMDVDLTGQIVIDGDSFFYTTGVTSSHSVNKCPLQDCTDDISIGYDLGTPAALAVDQADVFVLETTGRRLLHCGRNAGSCDKDIAKNTTGDGAIALGLSDVYWSVLGSSGGIYSCPRSGCPGGTPKVFASGVTSPRALATDLNDVWWTSYDDGTVSSCPLAGCQGPPAVVAKGQKNPLGVRSDGTRVYWANAGDGTVVTCPAAGCTDTPEVVVRGLDRPQWIALDGAHVYFATAGGVIGRTLK